MSYTKISNLFNIITQNSDYFKSYWAGYRHNVNENVVNNFNVDGNVGRLYPAVNWATPFGSSENVSDDSNLREDVKISLYFDNLQGRDNCGNQTNLTLNEQIDELKEQAFIFLDTFKELCFNKYSLGTTNSNVVNIDINSDAHNDSLLVVRLDFEFTMFLDSCLEVDTNIYPDEIPSCDLENYCDCSLIPVLPFINEYSMSFDGFNEAITIDNAFFNIDASLPFTFSAWVKADSLLYTNNIIVSKYQNPTGYFMSITNLGQIRLDLQNNGGVFRIYVISDALITLGTWVNATVTYDGSRQASGVKMYINGVESTTQPVENTLGTRNISNTASFSFGAILGASTYLDGFLNDFRAWDIVLSAADVLSEYNAGTPATPTNEANLLYRCAFGDGATFNTGVWTLPDEVNAFNYSSVNMDINNRVTDKP